MPVASLAAAFHGPRVVPQATGCTNAAERWCVRPNAAVDAYFAKVVAMPVASLVIACDEPRVGPQATGYTNAVGR